MGHHLKLSVKVLQRMLGARLADIGSSAMVYLALVRLWNDPPPTYPFRISLFCSNDDCFVLSFGLALCWAGALETERLWFVAGQKTVLGLVAQLVRAHA
ncbi:hypothetical protein [Acidiphilium sp. MT5]